MHPGCQMRDVLGLDHHREVSEESGIINSPRPAGLQPRGLRGQSKWHSLGPGGCQGRRLAYHPGAHVRLSRSHTFGLWGERALLISEPVTRAVRGNNRAVLELSKEACC